MAPYRQIKPGILFHHMIMFSKYRQTMMIGKSLLQLTLAVISLCLKQIGISEYIFKVIHFYLSFMKNITHSYEFNQYFHI